MPRHDFGPNLGEDLSVMVVARSEAHGALSAVGINSIWSISDDNQSALVVGPDLPEVNTIGIPRLPPKALEFQCPNTVFIGSITSTNEPSSSEIDSLFPSDNAGSLR
jgi:hypothetical protein